MNMLIIGGTGTISYGLAKEAISKGHSVTVINRGSRKNRIISGTEVINADINDEAKMKELLKGRTFDAVVDPLVFNVDDLKNHIHIFGTHCQKYVFISSCCAFGCSDENKAIDESSPMNPDSQYGKGKLACESYLKMNQFDFDYTIIRPYITYGDIRIPIPFACRRNPYTVIERIKENKPLVCFRYSGENRTCHNLMDISDFSKIGISVIESDSSVNNDYNVCSRKIYDWEEAYGLLYKKLGKEQHVYEIDKDYFRRIDNHLYEDVIYDKGHAGAVYSGEKALHCMKNPFQEISLEQGISNLVDYLEENCRQEPAEELFNIRTDMLLLLAVKKKDKFLKDYLHGFSFEYKLKLVLLWKLIPCRNFLSTVKRRVKSLVRWLSVK